MFKVCDILAKNIFKVCDILAKNIFKVCDTNYRVDYKELSEDIIGCIPPNKIP